MNIAKSGSASDRPDVTRQRWLLVCSTQRGRKPSSRAETAPLEHQLLHGQAQRVHFPKGQRGRRAPLQILGRTLHEHTPQRYSSGLGLYDLRGPEPRARQDELLGAARDRTKRASFLLSLNSPNSALGRFSESTSPLQSNVEQKRRLELADWTGRQVRKGKRGLIPEHIAPILESLEVNTQHWVKTVENHGSLFHRLVARADDMARKL